MDQRSLAMLGVACLCVQSASASAEIIALPNIDVVAAAPLSTGTDRDLVPAATTVLRRDDLTRSGPSDLLRTLVDQAPGVIIDEAQGNPFQPNLIYRGFEASPLVGGQQGLAVYLNGTRFNSPFGDTTNFDLIPDIAIDRTEISGSNPAFGLNALGGAVSIRLRDGFSYQGTELELSGGSYGRIRASAQHGVKIGNVAAYIAATGLDEDGWRDNSPSQLRQIYGDLGARTDRSEVHFSLLGAVDNLTGNGTAPVDLLDARRSAVFTYPDETRNKYLRAMLNGTTEINDNLSLQAAAYVSVLSQRTRNTDAAEAQPCDDDATLLCTGNGTPLTGRGGTPVPNGLNPGFFGATAQFPAGGPYALLNRTATDTTGYGASLQATYKSEILGRANRLLVGASYDGGSTTFSASSALGGLTLDRGFAGPGSGLEQGIVLEQADGSIVPVRVSAQNHYYGIYAQDAVDLTSALTVTLTGRFNVARIDLKDRNAGPLGGQHDYTHFNPGIGATYKILPSLTAYAGYSIANRVPTPAELTCASPSSPCSLTNFFVNDPDLKQVVAQTAEAGLRGRLTLADANIGWNGGLFRTLSNDDILFTGSDVIGRGYFQNVGKTLRQGVEAGLTLRRGPLDAFVNYSYTNATFQTPFTATSQDNPGADANQQVFVQKGNQIPGIPQHVLKVGVQYQLTPAWTVGTTGLLSSGRTLQGDPSNLTPRTPPYVLVNFNTKFRVTDNIELFGLVQNAADQKYATFGGFSPISNVPIVQAPNASNTRSYTPGPPLAGFGGVRVTF